MRLIEEAEVQARLDDILDEAQQRPIVIQQQGTDIELLADEDLGENDLTVEQRAELDRRWKEHLSKPGSAIPWEDVRRKLRERI